MRNHPKRLSSLLVALMIGGGGGAYAVAALGPDAAELPVRQVVQNIESAAQVSASNFDDFRFTLFRSEAVRSSDTADSLLQRLGVVDAAAAAFLRTDANARQQIFGRVGRSVSVETNDRRELSQLTVRWADDESATFQRLKIRRSAITGFTSRIDTGMLTASSQLASGTIQSSLFAATDDAKIPDSVALQLAEIFSSDIDFHRALRKGDRFSVVYETLAADGEPMRSGRVLSAEFVNAGKNHQALWFQEPGQKGAYYTPDGQSLQRAYLASPVQFSRISSGFKMRFHPILQQWKAHLGTDYAAPTGTAVRTVGDGIVEFAGVQNGFGNVVFIKHRNRHTTVYAHLSRINVARGQVVAQGQNIGAVGSTGWATGPHLHFEFRVDGAHQDPTILAQQSESVPISGAAQSRFRQLVATTQIQLSAAASVLQASAQ